MKKDITGLEDIKLLVDDFYRRVQQDALPAPVFNAVIRGSRDAQQQKMCNFRSTMLLYSRRYASGPMPKHVALPVEAAHFGRWQVLITETLDEHFPGNFADTAKTRAKGIARLRQSMKSMDRASPQPLQTI